ncbi:MAG TPA: DUF4430 domain-containing protein [Solirubrobacteraceae bacterium]|nr:DUF4430 domain-containing protein [Solirubrobacteraceae bacterium]
MLVSRIRSRSALAVSLCLALVLFCLSACTGALAAGAPATVTVRVEGLTETKVPATLLTTTTSPVVNDGNNEHACSGTSALGALQLATAGHWSGPWEAKFNQYAIYTIEGETHEFEEGASANYYWAFWVNNKEAEVGACEAELNSGDQVLFFPACYGSGCPTSPTPLGIEAPATANAGEAVTVTVKQYKSTGEASPAVGASVSGGGTSATTDSQGHATLKFSGDDTYTLRVAGSTEGPPAVRTETAICVHEGNDGTCGTTLPSVTPVQAPASSLVQPKPYTGPYALVANVTAPIDGHAYSRKHAPRLLDGKVIAHSAVTSISLRLRRTWRGRCWSYSGAKGRLVKVRCRRGGFFTIDATGSTFSYLLSSKLPPGRYVLDIKATDAAGNRTALDRGSSRIVFYVK